MRFPVAPNGPHAEETVARLVAKLAIIDDETSCWMWTASVDRKGYGVFHVRRDDGSFRQDRAHRVALEIASGSRIPPGLEAAHSCDVRGCARPSHLRAATHAENMNDAALRDRKVKKLTSARVAVALQRVATGERQARVAADMGVSRSTLSNIVNGRTRRHLPRPLKVERPPVVIDAGASGPERIAAIVRARADGHTLAEIGGALGVSRQRVEQLLRKAA